MKLSTLYLITIIMLLLGCGEGWKGVASNYTIRVTGSDQLAFSGHYTIAETGSIPRSVQVTGNAPMEYAGKGIAVTCIIRKATSESDPLKVEILRGKEFVSTAETKDPYGIITLGIHCHDPGYQPSLCGFCQ
jgi:hypothetical protein